MASALCKIPAELGHIYATHRRENASAEWKLRAGQDWASKQPVGLGTITCALSDMQDNALRTCSKQE